MHPVLADAVYPLAEHVAAVSLREAQVSPSPEHHRWCGQQVIEHVILCFKQSKDELRRRLASGESPARSASLLQWMLKTQVCFFHSMSSGIPASTVLRPSEFVPQDGAGLAARLLAEGEELNKTLAECRIAFGMRPCGYHPMYGPLRVEEWRVYHRVHCIHHLWQFDETIRLARGRLAGAEEAAK